MRKLPTALFILFLVITLTRVAQFSASAMAAGWLGWPFSIGLGLAVFVSAWFTRRHANNPDGTESRASRNVRAWAWLSLVLFVAADGAFNLWDVLQAVRAPELQAAAWIYGLFPTLAAALLGLLQGVVDKLPAPPAKYSVMLELRRRLVHQLRIPMQDAALPPSIPVEVTHGSEVHASLYKEPAALCACPIDGCGASFVSMQARAAHMRWKHSKNAEKVE